MFFEPQQPQAGKLDGIGIHMDRARKARPAYCLFAALEAGIATLAAPLALFFEAALAKEVLEGIVQIAHVSLSCDGADGWAGSGCS